MGNEWARATLSASSPRGAMLRAATMVAVALVLYGCKSSGTQETPPAAPPDDTGAVTQPTPAPDVQRDVDASGNPVDDTGAALARVFYFDYDRSVLQPESLTALEGHAAYLRSHADRRVMVEGHCDERGTREYNLALGERRGDAVRTFLVSSGVSRSQIEVVSYGEERPVDPGHAESALAMNRRAELIYR